VKAVARLGVGIGNGQGQELLGLVRAGRRDPAGDAADIWAAVVELRRAGEQAVVALDPQPVDLRGERRVLVGRRRAAAGSDSSGKQDRDDGGTTRPLASAGRAEFEDFDPPRPSRRGS